MHFLAARFCDERHKQTCGILITPGARSVLVPFPVGKFRSLLESASAARFGSIAAFPAPAGLAPGTSPTEAAKGEKRLFLAGQSSARWGEPSGAEPAEDSWSIVSLTVSFQRTGAFSAGGVWVGMKLETAQVFGGNTWRGPVLGEVEFRDMAAG